MRRFGGQPVLLFRLLLVVALVGGVAAPGIASDSATGGWEEEAELANPASGYDFFGVSVAIDRRTIVVGSYGDSSSVFRRGPSGWLMSAALEPWDGTEGGFGRPVDLDGNTIVVGSRSDDEAGDNAGAAYVFERKRRDWVPFVKLLPSDGSLYFGGSVAVDGDRAVVSSSSSVTIFEKNRSGWVKTAVLGPESLDESIRSVAIDGRRILVAGLHGHVFKRTRSGWVKEATLVPSGERGFYGPVSLDGKTAVMGAPFDGDAAFHSGAVYVFRRTGGDWRETNKLTASDAPAIARLGASVAVDGGTIVAGAWEEDYETGSAYVFDRVGSAWVETAKLLPRDPIDDGYGYGPAFGWSVALDGDRMVVGAPQTVVNLPEPSREGATYVFSRGP